MTAAADGRPSPLPRQPVLGAPGNEGEEIFAGFDTRIIRRFGRFMAPYRWTMIGAVASILVFVIAQIAIPRAIGVAIASTATHSNALGPVIGVFAGLVALHAVSCFFGDVLTAHLAQRVIFDLRRAMFSHLQDISLSFLDQTHVGRVMSRLQGDVNALQEFLEQSLGALGDLMLLVGIVLVLLTMSLKLGLLTLMVLPILVFIRSLWLPRVKGTFRRARDASSIANGALAEGINGVRVVQESQREAINLKLFEAKARENFEAQAASAWAAGIMTPTVDMLTGVAMAVVVVVGGEAVIGRTLDVGVMVAYILYVQRFFEPIRTLSMQYTTMQRAMAAGYRIFEVLDVPVTIADRPDAQTLDTSLTLDASGPSIELDRVTFGYRPGRPVLHNLSLTVEPGQFVALVGPTGSGKTSVAALVCRFYDVWEGAVRVGGHDVRDVTLASLGRTVAMVLQEPFLFSGTVLDNIRYATTTATREAVIAAAKAVSAHDFIMRLPLGYDTPLGQRGGGLSVGQRQLISFARALVADPQILILDEATANIDSFTELDIQRALKVLFAGRTSLVIAHRLATVRDADQIVVLQQGRIVEQGPHEALLRRKGLYAHLHGSNYASFDDLETDDLETMTPSGGFAQRT